MICTYTHEASVLLAKSADKVVDVEASILEHFERI